MSKSCQKLDIFSKKLPRIVFKKNYQCQFFGKNVNFWQFFEKKSQVFGNFLTFKWQFSGGSDSYIPSPPIQTTILVIVSPMMTLQLTMAEISRNNAGQHQTGLQHKLNQYNIGKSGQLQGYIAQNNREQCNNVILIKIYTYDKCE